ncbi:alanine/glycine:cation symporter family protein [Brackiella oedipodis]|uniref:alanine/glycine:cation symporter family protein n=1 Tax=Brackiella oedipodis TaxID=124225 RepID=UPI00048D8EB1|nr:sodium:alanine symporter family protein [Brackiella oedipodis]
METFESIVNSVNGAVWGPWMLGLLVGTGILLTIRLAFMQIWMLPYALKLAFFPHPKKDDGTDHEGDVSHFAALMTALSATIGTGNIAGVATAIVVGGPGAIFWMWLSAFFGMATKYAEGVLAVKYRTTNSKGEMSGGPMYYLQNGIKNKSIGRILGILFAIFAIVASFGIGSSVQSNSMAQAMAQSWNVQTWVTGAVVAVLTAIVVIGGIKSISTAASFIVPVMAVVYVVGGIVIIIVNGDLFVPAIRTIFHDAFTGQAVAGGAIFTVIRYGVARGVFSNEAGMGSAPIAAAAAKTDHPVRQALVSMTGTFLDTICVCSITGIVLVMALNSSSTSEIGDLSGAALTAFAFDELLPMGGRHLITFGLIFFAYSTILGWAYYGEKCVAYLFGEKGILPYRVVYIITVYLGAVVSLDLVWNLSDTFNGLMAVPNLIGLLVLSGVVVKETRDFRARRKSGELP